MSCGLVKALVCHRLSVIDQVFDRSWWTSRQAIHWIVGGLQGEVTQEVGETWSLWPAAVQIQRVSSGRFAGSSLQSSRQRSRWTKERILSQKSKTQTFYVLLKLLLLFHTGLRPKGLDPSLRCVPVVSIFPCVLHSSVAQFEWDQAFGNLGQIPSS